MAKVWLDVSSLLDPAGAVPAPQVDCARIALASEPGHFAFCAVDGSQGFRDVEPPAVQAALELLGQRAPWRLPRPRGWRRHAKQLIGKLPEPMQAPAMAVGRAGVRLFQVGGRRHRLGPKRCLRSTCKRPSARRTFMSRSAPRTWPCETCASACVSRHCVGGAAPSDASPMERWARAQVGDTREADGARVARTALVAASQGRTGFEDRLQHLYMSLLKEGDFCIDIGAHTGRHALPMSCVVGSGRVAAFEPNPPIAQRLRARLDTAGRGQCHGA